jgi:hypothetical protein
MKRKNYLKVMLAESIKGLGDQAERERSVLHNAGTTHLECSHSRRQNPIRLLSDLNKVTS